MSFIEGVGDEVTVFTVLLLVFILAATITFFLNSTPFSGNRQVLRVAPNSFSVVNQVRDHEPHENEESSQSDRNIDTTNQTTSSSSDVTQDEEVHSITEENRPNDIDNDNVCSEETTSQIYPEVSECDSVSAHVSEESDVEAESRPHSDPNEIHVRLKYLDDTERSVTSNPTVKIGDFKRTHFAEDIANNKIVRLIFSGQLLQDSLTLQSYGVANNCVVHVQVLQAQMQQNTSSVSQNVDLDLSHLLWPLLSVILGICWILYFKYPDFFNMMSLGMLFIFTGSFVYFYCQVQHQ